MNKFKIIDWFLINIIRTIALMGLGIMLLIPFLNIILLRIMFDIDGKNKLRGFVFDYQWNSKELNE